MPRHKLTDEERSRGGQAVADLTPPDCCPRTDCAKSRFKNWYAFIGHLGLHVFADRYCDGDMQDAARHFNLMGIAATDPFPQNGAFAEAHRVAAEVQTKRAELSLGD